MVSLRCNHRRRLNILPSGVLPSRKLSRGLWAEESNSFFQSSIFFSDSEPNFVCLIYRGSLRAENLNLQRGTDGYRDSALGVEEVGGADVYLGEDCGFGLKGGWRMDSTFVHLIRLMSKL